MHKRIVISLAIASFAFFAILLAWVKGVSEEGKTTRAMVSVIHGKGVTEVPVQPQKVAAFDLGVVDLISLFGVEVAGLPKEGTGGFSGLSDRLARYNSDAYANIRILQEPDFEALSRLAPDVILINNREEKAYDELSKIAPTLLLALDGRRIEESLKDITRVLGEIFGQKEKAESFIRDFEENVSKARALTQGKTALVLMTSGGKVSAYGAKTRFGFPHDVLGFGSLYHEKPGGRHGNVISPEFILESNPDWIFVIDRDTAIATSHHNEAGKAVMANPLIEKTQAHRAGQIIYLDSAALYLMANINTFNDLTKQITEALLREGKGSL